MPDLEDTRIENRWIVLPNHTNDLGTVHGGNVMKWMDEAGATSATRFAGESCVKASMNQVNFRRPVPVGDVALAEAFVYDAGRTIVRVRVKVFREDPQTAEREMTTETYVMFVAIDEAPEPTLIPDPTVATDEGARLRQEARTGEEQPVEECHGVRWIRRVSPRRAAGRIDRPPNSSKRLYDAITIFYSIELWLPPYR